MSASVAQVKLARLSLLTLALYARNCKTCKTSALYSLQQELKKNTISVAHDPGRTKTHLQIILITQRYLYLHTITVAFVSLTHHFDCKLSRSFTHLVAPFTIATICRPWFTILFVHVDTSSRLRNNSFVV